MVRSVPRIGECIESKWQVDLENSIYTLVRTKREKSAGDLVPVRVSTSECLAFYL